MTMTKEELHRFIEESTGSESNIVQIYAMKDGVTFYEDNHRGFSTADAMNVNSVTKGVMALIFGIAMDKGYVKSVDEKVLDFFPDYTVKRGEKTIQDVTIRHLLTMTAPYKGRSEPWKRVCTSPDWTKAALDMLGGRGGITGEFKYSTLGIQILAGVIENASGRRCLDLANEYLFAPLGIPEVKNHGSSSKEDQFDFLMNKNPRVHEWYTDPAGTVTAGWGLALSAEDMAKLGAMLLGGGVYGGKRVLSEEWIKQMLTPRVQLGERFGNMQYGCLWYRPFPDREVFAAIGDCGNIIYADPANGISVGMTGTFKPRIYDRVQFIEKYIVPLGRF